jgi:hypothetical protein
MSNPIVDFQSQPVNPGGMPTVDAGGKGLKGAPDTNYDVTISAADIPYEGAEVIPTEEEMSTLRKISAPMP